jgi:hypothetical protein
MTAAPPCLPPQRASAKAFAPHAASLVASMASLRSYGWHWLLPVVITAFMASAAFAGAPALDAWSTAQLSEGRTILAATSVGSLAMYAGGLSSKTSYASRTVDIYDVATGLWSTAQLSVARFGLSATSVQTLALFAGGSLLGEVCFWQIESDVASKLCAIES